MTRAFSWSAFFVALCLTGCVHPEPLPGVTPDISWQEMNWTCWQEAESRAPRGVGVVLGGLVGGAAGGALVGATGSGTDQRVAIYKECEARHGWKEASN